MNYERQKVLIKELWTSKGHNQGIMNIKRLQFSVMNNIVNDKKDHNITNDSFAHKPGGLLANWSSWDFFQSL